MKKKQIALLFLVTTFVAAWAQPKVAVLDAQIQQNMDPSIIVPVTDKIVEKLVQSGRFTVLDRANIESVLKEREFQMSGMTDQDAVAAGKYLNADFIVVTKITRVGDTNFVSGRLINVKTGAIQNSYQDQRDGKLSAAVTVAGIVGDKLAGGSGLSDDSNVVVAAPVETAPTPPPAPVAAAPVQQQPSYSPPSSSGGIARNFLGVGAVFSTDKWKEKDEYNSTSYTETDTYNLMTVKMSAIASKFWQFDIGLTWYTGGKNDWENTSTSKSGNASDPLWYGVSLKDCSLSWLDLGVKLRLPISIGSSLALVPLFGIEYDLNLSFKSDGEDVKQYLSDDAKAALNRFYFQLGLGMQIDFGSVVLYPEFVYGFKVPSKLDTNTEDSATSDRGWTTSTVTERKMDLGLIVGFKLN